MYQLVRLSVLGPFIGVAIAYMVAESFEYDSLSPNAEYWLIFVLISLLGLISPWIIKGIYFQHTAFSFQRQGRKLHQAVMPKLADVPSVELKDVADANSSAQAELLAKLQQLAPIHHAKLSLVIYDTSQRYLNVGQVGYQQLQVVVSKGVLAQTSQHELVKQIAESIVFQELCTGGVFNPPEDHAPANTFLPMKEDTPFVIALTLYCQVRYRLYKTNQLLGLSRQPSFEKRAQLAKQSFRELNQHWF